MSSTSRRPASNGSRSNKPVEADLPSLRYITGRLTGDDAAGETRYRWNVANGVVFEESVTGDRIVGLAAVPEGPKMTKYHSVRCDIESDKERWHVKPSTIMFCFMQSNK